MFHKLFQATPYGFRYASGIGHRMTNFLELMQRTGLTQPELSELLCVPVAKLTAYETGQTQPSGREIRILEGLGLAARASRTPTHELPVPRAIQSQMSFLGMSEVEAAVRQLASAGIEERGAIFTKREVVDFILDLVGYTPDRPLHNFQILEPSFGEGDFLFPALDRLFVAYKMAGHSAPDAVALLRNAVCGVELHRQTYDRTFAALLEYLAKQALNKSDCISLATAWLHQSDFL